LDFGRFFSELKRRRVVRVAGVYAVTSWAIFQVAAGLFPALHLPDWTVTLTAVLLMLGLPVALVIAWAFEASPQGVHATEAPAADAPKLKLAWSDWALFGIAAAVLAVSAMQITGLTPTLGMPSAGGAGKSVAVLPFVNMSTEKDGDAFADGLSEEVINGLAQIPDLKVAGRTSAFYFKGRNDDLRIIGQKLGVANVVEGSVRREGAKLRVTVQLIKVSDGFNVWSETYDRTMDDAFAIQTEIAHKVADELKVRLKLNPTHAATTLDPESYNAAVVARAQLRRIGLDDVTNAREGFKRLIDSGNADASVYAGYAESTMMLAQDFLTIDFNTADAESKTAIDKALALDPNSAEAQVARGWRCVVRTIRVSDQACAAEAATAYERALQLKPGDPDVLVGYANFLMKRPGGAEKALALLKRALQVDPLNRVALMLVANQMSDIGRYADAEKGYRSIIELYPEFGDAKESLAETLIAQGKLDAAEPWLRAAIAARTGPTAQIELVQLYLNLGMQADFDAALADMKSPALLAQLAQAIKRVTSEDYAGALAMAESQYASSKEPVWLSAACNMALVVHDYDKARTCFLKLLPGAFEPDPKIDPALALDSIDAAYVIDQQGDHGQARRIITKLLDATAPKPGVALSGKFRLMRVRAFAVVGDKEHALQELRSAIDGGYRLLWDVDAFVRLDRYPVMGSVKDDPRFIAMIHEIEADNARMRAQLLSQRAAPGAVTPAAMRRQRRAAATPLAKA
jgi:TolB-like protein/Tfp pilus assembly protein PilF